MQSFSGSSVFSQFSTAATASSGHLREHKLLVVQGSGFNWHEPDHFRVVYLPRIEVLKEAMDKLEAFLATYQQ